MTEPEEKPNLEIPAEEGGSSSENIDEVVTETYDKTFKPKKDAPPLYPPGVAGPSAHDKDL